MTFAIAATVSRNQKTVLDLALGKLQVLTAGDVLLWEVILDSPAGVVDGTTGAIDFAGFPKDATALAEGLAAKARFLTSANVLYKTIVTDAASNAIGITGSGAKLTISNPAGNLNILTGDAIEVNSVSWVL